MNLWNLLPDAPWRYPSWIPWLVAAGCWFFLALAVLCIVLSVKNNRQEIGRFLVFALVLRLLLVPWSPTTVPTASDPVAKWKHRSRDAEQILDTLKSDREVLQERLVRSQKGRPDLLQAEIDEIDDQIGAVEREKSRLEGVVVGMESRERRKERREMVSSVLSDEKGEESIRKEIEVGEGLLP